MKTAPGAPTNLGRIFDEGERAAIAAGGYELLLIQADAEAQPRPGQTPGDRRHRAALALRLLDRAAELGPPTRALYLGRARGFDGMGDGPAAGRERVRAEGCRPAGAADLFLVGLDCLIGADGRPGQGDLTRAVSYFDRALRRQPDHFWSRYYLAVAYLSMARPDLARV